MDSRKLLGKAFRQLQEALHSYTKLPRTRSVTRQRAEDRMLTDVVDAAWMVGRALGYPDCCIQEILELAGSGVFTVELPFGE